MSDIIEDLFITGGVLWLLSILIKGLVFFIFGVYIILFTGYAVCKAICHIFKTEKTGSRSASHRAPG